MDPQTSKIAELLTNPSYTWILLLITLWSLAWKGVALWKSARNSQKRWFIFLLFLNTLGILEIIYIFYFSKPKETKEQQNS